MGKAIQTLGPEHFLNRELSWLEFNQRVLDEALDPQTPLLERLKFFCITSSNLDEFFEVRVAGIKQQIDSEVTERSVDGRTASETLRSVTRRVRELVEQQYACWRNDLVPQLARSGIRFLAYPKLSRADQAWLEEYYRKELGPVLTPLAIDQAHPFPQLLNKTLNIMVQLEMAQGDRLQQHLAIVQLPRKFPRLIRLPRDNDRRDYVFLGHVIRHFLATLFPGTNILGCWQFRVTRNSELYIDEEEIANLLSAVEAELTNRRKGDAVRLEVEQGCPEEIRRKLLGELRLKEEDLYEIDGPLSPTQMMMIYDGDVSPELRDPAFVAPVAEALRDQRDLFEAIRKGDMLVHHPYDSFASTIELLEQAAEDPDVLAIKMTLYRTGGDTRLVGALMRAAETGKQVTAVVELRARFDEANNINWSRRLEERGVHVVYGLVGYKIHCKLCLIVRRDQDGIRRYLHLGTGNYNASTARLYTDLGLMTCRPDMGEDVTNLFNLLTGISQFHGTNKLLVAPFELHKRILSLIERETSHAQQGLPARITAKMNSLVDPEVIETLYRASQAGVQIDLIVRGVCCLKPGIPGLSENISVRSIVGRFLEHSRIFYFCNACQPEVYLGSADWMPRNFFRRIEVVFPIEDGVLRERIERELLGRPLADNVKARRLQPDGSYLLPKLKRGETKHCSQSEFIEAAVDGTRMWRRSRKDRSKFRQMQLAPSPHATS